MTEGHMSSGRWSPFLRSMVMRAQAPHPLAVQGKLARVTGLVLEATGLRVPVGAVCGIDGGDGHEVAAEVVGFQGERAYLMPIGDLQGLRNGARVTPWPAPVAPLLLGGHDSSDSLAATTGMPVPLGAGLLGRVLDGQGRPLDRRGPLQQVDWQPWQRQSINVMERAPVEQPLDTGVRALNALLTVGRGQRLGLFAGTGVGKSVLLGMMARYTRADVIVLALIGERGREVREFVDQILGPEGLARTVVIASTADSPPLMRLKGADYAMTVAEHFRAQGLHVLLLMDSLTRVVMAQREIALAIGEPPATKGYPPSCFARLPQLVERCGNGLQGQGSITGFFTVLTEGDDPQDPVADAARGILDGHIVLTRELAEAGHFPAIDVEKSLSRVMPQVVQPQQLEDARRIRQMLSRLARARDLLQIGAYQPGSDPELDLALRLQEPMNHLLRQDMREGSSMPQSLLDLSHLIALAHPGHTQAA